MSQSFAAPTRAEVVVFVVLVLFAVGLTLPAVNRTRQTERPVCQNNLKNIILALNAAASADPDGAGRFPAGTIPHPTLPPERRLSWCVAALPALECEPH